MAVSAHHTAPGRRRVFGNAGGDFMPNWAGRPDRQRRRRDEWEACQGIPLAGVAPMIRH
jgi:hypothetical protein